MYEDDTAIHTVRRATWIGLLANLALCAVKFAAGVLSHSQAVVADAVHSLSDSTTDVAVLVGSCFWGKPPDETHPYGHRRIETLVAIVVGLVLAGAGVSVALTALLTLRQPEPADSPGLLAFAAAVVSIVCKESLYRWTLRVGSRVRSLALEANAWHHRSDALSSIPTAVAVGCAVLFPRWSVLDHIGAAIVSLFILQAAFRILLPGLRELAESGAPSRVREHVADIARTTPGVRDVHALRTRYVGAHLHVDLHVLVDGGISVREGHEIASSVTRRVLDRSRDVIDVVVHTEPG